MIYLDANASEPLRPEARDAMAAAWASVGNPASVHAAGRAARATVEDAREAIARRFGGRAGDLVFTSGGTEADALAIHALGRGRRLIVSAIEHDAVRAQAEGAAILPVRADGRADLDALETLLRDNPPSLVCLMAANNETGVMQPIAEAGALCRQYGALLHVDAAQAAGRVPTKLDGCDSLALSAHKLGGPVGVGALLVTAEHTEIPALIRGGGQERGRRGGSLPAPLIAGFAAALTGATPDLTPLRDAVEHAARAQGALVVGAAVPRLPNTSCLVLPSLRGETQLIALDLAGVAVSAGAACSSGKVARSHVLEAMGLGAQAGEAIRVSLPWNATMADVRAFARAYQAMAERRHRRAA
jgi:cysteine desulfurase